MISQNIAGRLRNITSILNNFKSLIKQVYQIRWVQNIKKKENQNNYFRAEISEIDENFLQLKKKIKLIFNNWRNLPLLKNQVLVTVNVPTHKCPARNWQQFLILTH